MMATIPNVVGPSWPSYSKNEGLERTINWFPEQPDGGATGKNPQGDLLPRPGLTPGWTLPDGPVRGLFSQDGRVFAVGGTSFCELFETGTVVSLGSVAIDGNPVTFATNGTAGNQVILTSGGRLYLLDLLTNTFGVVPLVNFLLPAVMVVFLDGYFISLRGGTRQFYLSALEDGSTWDILDVNEVSKFSDNLRAIAVSHEVLWLFGSLHSLPYVDTGDLDVPFQPIPETLVEHGVYSPFSIQQCDNTLVYQAQDALGALQVVRLNGYTPQIISTFGMQTYMQTAQSADTVIAWTYQDMGHLFYHMYFPTLNTSPVYDVATGLWHERSLWSPLYDRHFPHLGRCHCWAFNRHLVGDRQSGTVYRQSMQLFFDDIVATSGAVA